MLKIMNAMHPKYDMIKNVALTLVIGILGFIVLSVSFKTVNEDDYGTLFALSSLATAFVVFAHRFAVKFLDRQTAKLVAVWASS